VSVLTHEINSRKIAQAAVWTSGSILLVRLFFSDFKYYYCTTSKF